jgi:uncharacterized membrane protein YjjP (DUF1212 family)
MLFLKNRARCKLPRLGFDAWIWHDVDESDGHEMPACPAAKNLTQKRLSRDCHQQIYGSFFVTRTSLWFNRQVAMMPCMPPHSSATWYAIIPHGYTAPSRGKSPRGRLPAASQQKSSRPFLTNYSRNVKGHIKIRNPQSEENYPHNLKLFVKYVRVWKTGCRNVHNIILRENAPTLPHFSTLSTIKTFQLFVKYKCLFFNYAQNVAMTLNFPFTNHGKYDNVKTTGGASEAMDTGAAIKLAILAGEIMLSSGAETSRVEDTMLRIMRRCGACDAESLCTSTGIFASAADHLGNPTAMLKRVKHRGGNFAKVAQVNELSRKFVDGKIGIDEAIAVLEGINATPPYPNIVRLVGSAVASLCFAAMFGGLPTDALAAFISAFLMQIPVIYLEKRNVAAVLRNITGGACGALIALILIRLGMGENLDFVIIGAIMPLVPGVALTNAIRDILEGDLLSGSARILDAFLVAIGIAAGVGTVLTLWISLIGPVAGGGVL